MSTGAPARRRRQPVRQERAGSSWPRRAAGTALLLAPALVACASQPAPPREHLTVFAAASLHEALAELATAFEQAHDADVTFSFAGSSDLVAQVAAGAPADVLVTADERTMARAVDDSLLAGDPVPVATNHLALVTPPGNPGAVTGLDGSLDGASVVVCAPRVPCGAAAVVLAEQHGLELDPVSEEPSVTAVLSKITTGQADAGLVYASDAAGAGAAVATIPVPGAERVVNTYWAGAVAGADAEEGATAAAWLDWMTGPQGGAALVDAGFRRP